MTSPPKIVKLHPREILVEDSENPRVISESKLNSLEKSINEFGVLQPIVVNKRTNKLLSGHQRFKILKKKDEEIDVWLVDLDEFSEHAASITLNQEAGEFDDDKLAEIINEIDESKYELTGFDNLEIETITKTLDTTLDSSASLLAKEMDIYKQPLVFESLENKYRWENFIDICKSKAEHNRPITDHIFELIDKIQSTDEIY